DAATVPPCPRARPSHAALAQLPLSFIENRGQVDDQVRFYARCAGMTAYFTRDSFRLQLVRAQPLPTVQEPHGRPAQPRGDRAEQRANLFLEFEGASEQSEVSGMEQLPGRYNFFLGKDASRWRTNVPAYARICYRNLYPGIDLIVHEHDHQLEYDLVL